MLLAQSYSELKVAQTDVFRLLCLCNHRGLSQPDGAGAGGTSRYHGCSADVHGPLRLTFDICKFDLVHETSTTFAASCWQAEDDRMHDN